jgi:CPA1 family monovalent cation:H+ antiporter
MFFSSSTTRTRDACSVRLDDIGWTLAPWYRGVKGAARAAGSSWSGRQLGIVMTDIEIAAIILSLTAGLAYLNARWVKLPPSVGLMAIALVGSFVVIGLDAVGAIDTSRFEHVIARADFADTLLHGMLGLLLFAGALQLDVDALAEQRLPVVVLSLVGTVVSTLLVGGAIFAVFGLLGRPLPLVDAMLFGALISPTDPVAVLSVLRSSKVPKQLAIQIAGESLFNDGVGVVLFTVVLATAGGAHVTAWGVVWLFVRVAFGGAAFGLGLGLAARYLLRSMTDYAGQVLITLALVLGGYSLAEELGLSAPIAMVVAGLVVGQHRSAATDDHLVVFWQMIDEILNAVLFLMLGLEATRLVVSAPLAVAAAIAVPLVLGARLASVAASISILRPFTGHASRHALAILTWGGLRGGLSVALALALPASAHRDEILAMTYAVVCFAILVQGLTLGRLLRRFGLVT